MSNTIGWRDKEHLLSIKDLSREDIESILHASKILHPYSGKGNKLNILRGHILKPVFFESSTRTLNSFVSAMITMGGDDLPPHTEIGSSREKGETKLDTLITVSQFCDIIAIRDTDPHTMSAYVKLSKKYRIVPLINCGSGADEHPTQTLLDLYTIREELGSLDNIVFLVTGDLKYSRVAHSLIHGIRKFSGNKVIGFPVKDLKLPDTYRWDGYEEYDISDLIKVIKEVPSDSKVVLYLTRVQWERIAKERTPEFDRLSRGEKEKLRQQIQLSEYFYEITPEVLDALPENSRLLHILPRGPEIGDKIFFSLNPKVIPIDQMRYGLDVRMALLGLFCGKEAEILELASR